MLWHPKSNRIKRYKKIRETGRALNSRIIEVIPREVINRTAKDMNMMSRNTLVLDSEDETDFLFDRMVFDVPWNGKTAIEHFETESGSSLPVEEQEFLEGMKEAYFSIFEVIGGVAGEFLRLSDLLSDNQIDLVDISLSTTTLKRFLLATRVIKVQDIHMTAGIGYPFLIEQRDTIMSGLKKRQTVRRSKKRGTVRRIDFSDPRNYSLYFYRQYKRIGKVEMRLSEELQ